MSKKPCKVCGSIKPLDEFHLNGKTSGGNVSRRPECKPCYNAKKGPYNRQRYHNSKRARDLQREASLRHYEANKDCPEYKAMRRRAQRRRRQDPGNRLAERLSTRMRHVLRTGKDSRSWQQLVDYNASLLYQHIESRFLPGMGWHNRDQWEVDHIIPLAAFSFTRPEDADFKAAWDLANLQPLWKHHNRRKSAKWNGQGLASSRAFVALSARIHKPIRGVLT